MTAICWVTFEFLWFGTDMNIRLNAKDARQLAEYLKEPRGTFSLTSRTEPGISLRVYPARIVDGQKTVRMELHYRLDHPIHEYVVRAGYRCCVPTSDELSQLIAHLSSLKDNTDA